MRNQCNIKTDVENKLKFQNNVSPQTEVHEAENEILIKLKKHHIEKYLSETRGRMRIKNEFIDSLALLDHGINCNLRFDNTVYVKKQNSRKKSLPFLNTVLFCSYDNQG